MLTQKQEEELIAVYGRLTAAAKVTVKVACRYESISNYAHVIGYVTALRDVELMSEEDYRYWLAALMNKEVLEFVVKQFPSGKTGADLFVPKELQK